MERNLRRAAGGNAKFDRHPGGGEIGSEFAGQWLAVKLQFCSGRGGQAQADHHWLRVGICNGGIRSFSGQRQLHAEALAAERQEGKSPREAIRQACLLRFRPILMTTMAALLAALPLMLGTGVGSELRHPLGITMVGGLLFSQVLTLFTTPVIYLAFDRLAQRMRSRGIDPEGEVPSDPPVKPGDGAQS